MFQIVHKIFSLFVLWNIRDWERGGKERKIPSWNGGKIWVIEHTNFQLDIQCWIQFFHGLVVALQPYCKLIFLIELTSNSDMIWVDWFFYLFIYFYISIEFFEYLESKNQCITYQIIESKWKIRLNVSEFNAFEKNNFIFKKILFFIWKNVDACFFVWLKLLIQKECSTMNNYIPIEKFLIFFEKTCRYFFFFLNFHVCWIFRFEIRIEHHFVCFPFIILLKPFLSLFLVFISPKILGKKSFEFSVLNFHKCFFFSFCFVFVLCFRISTLGPILKTLSAKGVPNVLKIVWRSQMM